MNFDNMVDMAQNALSGRSSGNTQVDKMIASLKPEDAKRLKMVLSDRKMAERIIATPEAQKLLRQLMDNQKK